MKIYGVELILDNNGNVIAGIDRDGNMLQICKLDITHGDYTRLNPMPVKTAKQGLYKGRYIWK